MTEAEWLTSTDPAAMLSWVSSQPADRATKWTRAPVHYVATARKLRLFACACCRQVWDGAPCPWCCTRPSGQEWMGTKPGMIWECAISASLRGVYDTRLIKQGGIPQQCGIPYATQAALLRCIFGNPFRSAGVWGGDHEGNFFHWNVGSGAVSVSPPWLTPTVLAVARSIYDGRRWDDLPVLADALEEAGCNSADLLAHLRDPGPHARGCWAVDLILGKE